MTTRMTGWGGTMAMLNVLIKLCIATHAYRLCDELDDFAAEGMAPGGEGGAGPSTGAGGFPTAYHAPSRADEDFGAAEAGEKGAVGEVTRYRAI
jgi:hypothetical protein